MNSALDQILAAFHDKRDILELHGQNLTELPPQIGMLTELQVLSLSSNRLTRLPPEIGNLSKLVELALDENRLTDLPPDIGRLTSLEILLLANNQLCYLPRAIGKLTRLRRLDIQNNCLTELPAEFAELTRLRDFDWEKWKSSPRKGLPPSNIRNFLANGNAWIYPPAQIMKREVDEIQNYLKGESLDNPLLNGNGMNLSRWASPPSPDPQPGENTPWTPPACPQPPPLPRITFARILPGAPQGFSFQSTIDVPGRTEPHIEARLRKEFPECHWQDQAENWDKVRIEGISQNAPRGHVNIYIGRKESPGPFKLIVAIGKNNQSEADKLHSEVIRRLTWALIGWSQSPLPRFKPAIEQEEIIQNSSAPHSPHIIVSSFNADISCSRTLIEALSLHREVLASWAPDDPENRAALLRGSSARLILRQSVSTDTTSNLYAPLTLVRPAHTLLAELLQLGLAQVIQYAPDRQPLPPAQVKLLHCTTHICCTAANSEFLRLHL